MPERTKNQKELEKEAMIKIGIAWMDAANKWGTRYLEKPEVSIIRTKQFGLEEEITIFSDNRSDRQLVFIRKGDHDAMGAVNLPNPNSIVIPLPAGQVQETLESGILQVITKKEGGIIWDKDLSVETVSGALAILDQTASERGLFDTKTGQRKQIPEDEMNFVPMPKTKVDEVFGNGIGTLMPIFPSDAEIENGQFSISAYSIEKLLSEFDDPNKLTVRYHPYTGEPIGLVLKSDVDFLDKRDQIINSIFQKAKLSPKELEEGIIGPYSNKFVQIALEIRKASERRTNLLLKAERIRRHPKLDDLAEFTRSPLIKIYEGEALENGQQFNEGEDEIKALIRQYPSSSYIPHEYAVALIDTLKFYGAAYPYFLMATERFPQKAQHYYNAGRCVLKLEKYPEKFQEAFDLFKKAAKQKDHDEYLDSLNTTQLEHLFAARLVIKEGLGIK